MKGLGIIARIAVIFFSILLIVTAFLPCLEMEVMGKTTTITLLKTADESLGDGVYFIIFAIACIGAVLVKNQPISVLILSACVCYFCISEINSVKDAMNEIEDELGAMASMVNVDKKIGYFTMIISSFGLLAASLLNMVNFKKRA